MSELFRKFSHGIASLVGSAGAFIAAAGIVIIWACTGPLFDFSNTWQLVINTGTTIVTFLMVFLIQNSQNRDARAIHLKLDELLRAVGGARNSLVNLENLSDAKLLELQQEFERIQTDFGVDSPHVDHIEKELESRKADPSKRRRPPTTCSRKLASLPSHPRAAGAFFRFVSRSASSSPSIAA